MKKDKLLMLPDVKEQPKPTYLKISELPLPKIILLWDRAPELGANLSLKDDWRQLRHHFLVVHLKRHPVRGNAYGLQLAFYIYR